MNEPDHTNDSGTHIPAGQNESAWIHGKPRHDKPITLCAYNPDWPVLFRREADRIRRILGETVRAIEHVGSTSVPGLSAKPIIDILLVVSDPSDEPRYVAPLEAEGYRLVIREPDWNRHRVLKGPDTDINLHVLPEGSEEVRRMTAFRDRLRSTPEDRTLYERTKRELAARTWTYVQDYADAKSRVVEEILSRAFG